MVSILDIQFNHLTSYFCQAKEKLAEVDGMLDLLMSSLKDLDRAGCVNILVVSDHGATPATCSSSFYLETFLSNIDEKANVYTGAVGRLRTIPGGTGKLKCIVFGVPCFTSEGSAKLHLLDVREPVCFSA